MKYTIRFLATVSVVDEFILQVIPVTILVPADFEISSHECNASHTVQLRSNKLGYDINCDVSTLYYNNTTEWWAIALVNIQE